MSLYRITAPHFCAGIEIGGKCAPILRYMRGWAFLQILIYCMKKGWTLEEVTT